MLSILVTSISNTCVYPALPTSLWILLNTPSSLLMHEAEHLSGRRCSAHHIDNPDTLSLPCPVSGSLGTGVRVGGSPSGSSLTDIIHRRPTQMVFIQM